MNASLKTTICVITLFLLSIVPSRSEELTLASWNIEHLSADGEGCRPRTEEDYLALKAHVKMLDADIIAFQEVENLAAAKRVFDEALWDIYIAEAEETPTPSIPCELGSEKKMGAKLTGFAVKRETVNLLSSRTIPSLAIPFTKSVEEALYPETTPAGYELIISVAETEIALLATHMQPGCFEEALDTQKNNCEVLSKQTASLAHWIDEKASKQQAFIILGDFNRRFDTAKGDLWQRLSDGNPSNATLWRPTEGRSQRINCWKKADGYIDHIIFDRLSKSFYVANSFTAVPPQNEPIATLSDHCPIKLEINVPARPSTALQWTYNSIEGRIFIDLAVSKAADRLDEIALTRKEEQGKWAVAFDVDETLLSNAPYTRLGDIHKLNFDEESWNYWVNSETAQPLPGMFALMQKTIDLGGYVLITTNRDHELQNATWRNLASAWAKSEETQGQIDPSKVCLMNKRASDKPFPVAQSQKTSNSKDRRRISFILEPGLLCEKSAPPPWTNSSQWQGPFDIVMYLGDRVEDFPCVTQKGLWTASKEGKSLHEIPINCAVTELGIDGSFGDYLWREFFLLPNPMYGGWQRNKL